MATTRNQNVQQAVVISGTSVRPGQNAVQLELFDAEGNPWNLEGASGGVSQEQVDAAIEAAIAPLQERLDNLESSEPGPEETPAQEA